MDSLPKELLRVLKTVRDFAVTDEGDDETEEASAVLLQRALGYTNALIGNNGFFQFDPKTPFGEEDYEIKLVPKDLLDNWPHLGATRGGGIFYRVGTEPTVYALCGISMDEGKTLTIWRRAVAIMRSSRRFSSLPAPTDAWSVEQRSLDDEFDAMTVVGWRPALEIASDPRLATAFDTIMTAATTSWNRWVNSKQPSTEQYYGIKNEPVAFVTAQSEALGLPKMYFAGSWAGRAGFAVDYNPNTYRLPTFVTKLVAYELDGVIHSAQDGGTDDAADGYFQTPVFVNPAFSVVGIDGFAVLTLKTTPLLTVLDSFRSEDPEVTGINVIGEGFWGRTKLVLRGVDGEILTILPGEDKEHSDHNALPFHLFTQPRNLEIRSVGSAPYAMMTKRNELGRGKMQPDDINAVREMETMGEVVGHIAKFVVVQENEEKTDQDKLKGKEKLADAEDAVADAADDVTEQEKIVDETDPDGSTLPDEVEKLQDVEEVLEDAEENLNEAQEELVVDVVEEKDANEVLHVKAKVVKKITIRLQPLGDSPKTLEFLLSDTVQVVKEAVRDSFDFRLDEIRLVFEGRQLSNPDETLKDFRGPRIATGSTIYIILAERPRIPPVTTPTPSPPLSPREPTLPPRPTTLPPAPPSARGYASIEPTGTGNFINVENDIMGGVGAAYRLRPVSFRLEIAGSFNMSVVKEDPLRPLPGSSSFVQVKNLPPIPMGRDMGLSGDGFYALWVGNQGLSGIEGMQPEAYVSATDPSGFRIIPAVGSLALDGAPPVAYNLKGARLSAGLFDVRFKLADGSTLILGLKRNLDRYGEELFEVSKIVFSN